MATLNIASKANQAKFLPALLIAAYATESEPNASIRIKFQEIDTLKSGDETAAELILGSDSPIYDSEKIITKLVETYPFLQGKNESLVSHPFCQSKILLNCQQIQEWLNRTARYYPTDFKSVEGPLLELDSHLTLRSYIVGYTLNLADLSIWGAIRGNKIAHAAMKKGSMLNASRWFRFVEDTNPWIASTIQSMNAQAQEKKAAKSKEGASYDIALLDTEKGVVTRFPPEPS